MSSAVEFVKKEVLEHFVECRADAGHAINDRAFYHQRMSSWNPKQQDALDAGIEELVAEGLVEPKGNSVFLTAKGVEVIYPSVGNSVRNAILTCFVDSRARAGHALNGRALLHQQMISWNPKQKAALDSTIAALIAEGIVEEKNDNLFLTQKGEDTIY